MSEDRPHPTNDFYRRLDVGLDASRDDIVYAYRRLAHSAHPDSHPGDPDAARRFRELNEAYEVLVDPARRAGYDRSQHPIPLPFSAPPVCMAERDDAGSLSRATPPARLLRELGFDLRDRAAAGDSPDGAWYATGPDGESVILKWFRDETVADRYALLLPALEMLRSRGVPVPEYRLVRAIDGLTVAAQRTLPGRPWEALDGHGARPAPPHMVDRVIECVAAAVDIVGPLPAPSSLPWGEFMIRSLTIGEDGWVMHDPLRASDARSAALLDRIEAVGADADAAWFPTNGLVHLDLHTGNMLASEDGHITGIIDWEGACAGDHCFDLATFAFDLDGAGQRIWDRVERLIEPRLLRAYVAHMALRCTDWAIRYHPEDIPRQLDRAERVLGRYGG